MTFLQILPEITLPIVNAEKIPEENLRLVFNISKLAVTT